MTQRMQQPIRVLHVLHHIFHYPCGYRTRSENILRHQHGHGIESLVITACDHEGLAHLPDPPGLAVSASPRHRGSQRSGLREWQLMRELRRQVEQAIDRFNPDVVHGHSPVLVAWPAMSAAKRKRRPFVYEVRDLWENAAVDLGKLASGSFGYRAARAIDGYVLKRADAVTVICDSMRQELGARLGGPERIFIANNGVDLSALRTEVAETSRRQLNLPIDAQVLGFIGTLQPYEGLDLLFDALPELLQRVPNVHVLITGDGNHEAALRAQVARLGLERSVTFTGRVAHDQVSQAYAASDLLVYPRRHTETTRLTTPLKPLEAMALGKAVLASDLPPFRELIGANVRGRLFAAEQRADLIAQTIELLKDPGLRDRLGATAREWVTRERQWPMVVASYRDAYAAAMNGGAQ
jgi:PEP-CTERM/exosortase A-associated glycosyltransferase